MCLLNYLHLDRVTWSVITCEEECDLKHLIRQSYDATVPWTFTIAFSLRYLDIVNIVPIRYLNLTWDRAFFSISLPSLSSQQQLELATTRDLCIIVISSCQA